MTARSLQTLHLVDAEYLRYLQKLTFVHQGEELQLQDPYIISDKWTEDVSKWPEVSFGDIYTYLVDSPGNYTRETMKAYKSLEGQITSI